jgi:hypothetical protein
LLAPHLPLDWSLALPGLRAGPIDFEHEQTGGEFRSTLGAAADRLRRAAPATTRRGPRCRRAPALPPLQLPAMSQQVANGMLEDHFRVILRSPAHRERQRLNVLLTRR